MKYFLLTFNEDWADEHDVPALACFNENEYEEWLNRPSGKLNPKYEKQLEKYKAKPSGSWESPPPRCFSYISASLGNGGDCFDENYTDYYLMKEFLADKTVSVFEVDESFHKYFHAASLSNLSLCNIFDADILDYGWNDDEEE